MTRRMALIIPLFFLAPGCEDKPVKPENKEELARQAGQIAALSYLAIEKPTNEEAAAIKVVIDEITASLKEYQQGGFKSALPKVKEAIAKAFPKEEQKGIRLLADKLAETLIDELDKLFDRHPDWKELGNEVAGIVGAFTGGASKAFEDYIKT